MLLDSCCNNYTIKIKSIDQYKKFLKKLKMQEPSFEEKKTKINEFISFLMFLFHYFPLNHRKSIFQVN